LGGQRSDGVGISENVLALTTCLNSVKQIKIYSYIFSPAPPPPPPKLQQQQHHHQSRAGRGGGRVGWISHSCDAGVHEVLEDLAVGPRHVSLTQGDAAASIVSCIGTLSTAVMLESMRGSSTLSTSHLRQHLNVQVDGLGCSCGSQPVEFLWQALATLLAVRPKVMPTGCELFPNPDEFLYSAPGYFTACHTVVL
jgi:hypothetical protein